jgi:hypothetical protein
MAGELVVVLEEEVAAVAYDDDKRRKASEQIEQDGGSGAGEGGLWVYDGSPDRDIAGRVERERLGQHVMASS